MPSIEAMLSEMGLSMLADLPGVSNARCSASRFPYLTSGDQMGGTHIWTNVGRMCQSIADFGLGMDPENGPKRLALRRNLRHVQAYFAMHRRCPAGRQCRHGRTQAGCGQEGNVVVRLCDR